MRWVEALKIWNAEHNPGKWCVAKKGTPEYAQVRAIMDKDKPKKVERKAGAKEKPAAKMDMSIYGDPSADKEASRKKAELINKKAKAIKGILKATAKKRIAKAILKRVMEKRAKSGVLSRINDEWKGGYEEGFDDGENPVYLAKNLAEDIKNASGSSVEHIQGFYWNYGGNGSGGGNFLDGVKEAYSEMKPSFKMTVGGVNIKEPNWEKRKAVKAWLKKVNLSDLADMMDTDEDYEVSEPTSAGAEKITVSWKSPEEKAAAVSFFEKLGAD